MAMIERYQCDRCGGDGPAGMVGCRMNATITSGKPRSYDLCEDCTVKLGVWLDVPGQDLKAKRLRDR